MTHAAHVKRTNPQPQRDAYPRLRAETGRVARKFDATKLGARYNFTFKIKSPAHRAALLARCR